MRLILSLILAFILATGAYAGFWWFSLTFSAKEMRGVVEQSLRAQSLSYGEPSWVPDWSSVAVRLPQAKLAFADGPVREVRMPYVVMVSEFFSRSGWQLLLPPEMEVQLAGGRVVRVKSRGAELAWLAEGGQMSFRAGEVQVFNEGGAALVQVRDVMVERRATDHGVRVNLASRPEMNGSEGILSGQLVLPEQALVPLIDALVAGNGAPKLNKMLLALVDFLAASGEVARFENVSFKHAGMSFAVYGDLKVARQGEFAGELVLATDKRERLLDWVVKAQVVAPRSVPENLGWREAQVSVKENQPVLRVAVIPDALVLNGLPVGEIPRVREVVERLW
ncbi:MAG: hypothetical protein EBR79_01255 [Proteobacteria bacterium]|nr:hypothetical protein [Pseudomonadota bacterium]NBX86030.1 hypothetical protein [Pseudomonadota bacterium]